MKKLILIFAAIVTLGVASCGNGRTTASNAVSSDSDSIVTVDSDSTVCPD